jgi:hypothetical protein
MIDLGSGGPLCSPFSRLAFYTDAPLDNEQLAESDTDLPKLRSVAPRADIDWVPGATELGTRSVLLWLQRHLHRLKANRYEITF